MANTQLSTRKPTGKVPYPLILLEGVEKSGKTYAAAELSGDARVGRTLWFDLGEGAADEYASLGTYEVVNHSGTYDDFLAQLTAAVNLEHDPAAPTMIVIDSITALWTMLVNEATDRAVRRDKTDAHGEPVIGMDLWVTAKRKWRAVLDPLMSYPGLVVLTARGKEVAEVNGSRPTGRRLWRVEGEKSLCYDATVWIRYEEPRKPLLAGVRSLTVDPPQPGGTRELRNFTLSKFVFDELGCDATVTQARDYRAPTADTIAVRDAQGYVLEAAGGDKVLAREVWDAHHLGDTAPAREALTAAVTDARERAQKADGDTPADDTQDPATGPQEVA